TAVEPVGMITGTVAVIPEAFHCSRWLAPYTPSHPNGAVEELFHPMIADWLFVVLLRPRNSAQSSPGAVFGQVKMAGSLTATLLPVEIAAAMFVGLTATNSVW